MVPPKPPVPITGKDDVRRDFTRGVLPWLVAAAMLLVYWCTLGHWISAASLPTVAQISGWYWVPTLTGPLYQLATLPLRILPTAMIPFAVNFFSAVCAALALWLLTRSVGILPHDRTDAQTAREKNSHGLLTLGNAWMPPLLATLVCGLQLTFWQWATNGSSEMFDLLMFAVVIWLILEYRLDLKEGRLFLSAWIVGASVAEGPAMTGFFFLYIIAIIWSRGYDFFNWAFLRGMMFWGLAGFSLFLLLPVWAMFSSNAPGSFLSGLKFSLTPQYEVLKLYFLTILNIGDHLDDVVTPLFVALVPVLLLSIKWTIGDKSRMGSNLANFMFLCIHAVFLCLCLWLMFDPPFSPREKGFTLTLYYLIALSAGYYAGYFLLVFGKPHPRAGEFEPIFAKLFKLGVVVAVWLASIGAVAGLIYKNRPVVRMTNDDTFRQYATLLVEKLPQKGAMVLSDDPGRLYLAQAALVREKREKNYILLDSKSLLYPQYHRYLHEKWPHQWPLLVSSSQADILDPTRMMAMLTMLSKSNELCYLHPSYGFYFENTYQEQHGLIYQLKALPADTLLPPPPEKTLIAENQAFWADTRVQGMIKSVEEALATPTTDVPMTPAQTVLKSLHVPREGNVNAAVVGTYCSRSLDFWGVELQRAGEFTNAAGFFKTAISLNPDNMVAQTNLLFNADLRAGHRHFVDLSLMSSDSLGKFNSIGQAISEGGPFDEPSFCYWCGYVLDEYNGFPRQAAAQFERVHELDPGYLPAIKWLAQIYGLNNLPDRTLEVLRGPLEHPQNYTLEPSDISGMNMMAIEAYVQKNDKAGAQQLLDRELSRNPTNEALFIRAEQLYLGKGWYTNALALVNFRLQQSPDDPKWLFTKAYVDNRLKRYDDAIMLLNGILATATNKTDALTERAAAYMGSSQWDAARSDYLALQKEDTNSFPIAYNLGEIAWRQHETNEAIRNFEIYLVNSPTNQAEEQQVKEQLHQLRQAAGGK